MRGRRSVRGILNILNILTMAWGMCLVVACGGEEAGGQSDTGQADTCATAACTGATDGDAPADAPDAGCDGEPCDDPSGAPSDPGDDSGDGDRPDPDGGSGDPSCEDLYDACMEAGTARDVCGAEREACESETDEGTGGELPGPSGVACCEDARADCEASGDETAATCADIEQICASEACEGLPEVCPPTAIPVSEACAEAYYRCFGATFLVNKCQRMSHANCMAALGDEALCDAWEQSCAQRETDCAELLGCADPHTLECAFGGGSMYTCTDWGHGFDRCWTQYEACTDTAEACSQALDECANGYIYAWKYTCDGFGDPFPGGDDEPSSRG